MSIKEGDWVAFQAGRVVNFYVACPGFGDLDISCVTPIPPPDPHWALKNAVAETSLRAHKRAVQEYGADYADDCWRPHAKACEDLLDAQFPPDPVEVAWEAYIEACSLQVAGSASDGFRSALKAYDTAIGRKS